MNSIQFQSIHPLRAIPIAVYKVENLISDSDKNKIKYTDNWRSSDVKDSNVDISLTYKFLEENGMQDLLLSINKCVEKYTREILGVDLKVKPIGTWVTRQKDGGVHASHSHPNSLISVVTYFKDPVGEIADLIFLNNGLKDIFSDFQGLSISEKITAWNLFNNITYKITPEEDQVIIFPSHMLHRSGVSVSGGTRYCIGVNYFIEDMFGNESSKSTITLSC